jgi:uncharacterized membrane protein YfcA
LLNLDYWFIFPLALLGAIVANATGAGGGVVFVPAFHMLGMGEESIIATSFAIQCFGMTAGMLAWRRLANERHSSNDLLEAETWLSYQSMINRLALPAIAGVLVGQYLISLESAEHVRLLFKYFSIVFGLMILGTTVYLTRLPDKLKPMDLNNGTNAALALVCLIGGVITAWLSIGVGELVAVTLILMRFPVRYAIGVAVSISAISVWIGVQFYLWVHPTINFEVLLFAAPAALIGGSVAKRVVSYFSPVQLKVFIASWILISAIAM